jgi:hypothetical protein
MLVIFAGLHASEYFRAALAAVDPCNALLPCDSPGAELSAVTALNDAILRASGLSWRTPVTCQFASPSVCQAVANTAADLAARNTSSKGEMHLAPTFLCDPRFAQTHRVWLEHSGVPGVFVRVTASAADIAAFAEHRPVSADYAAYYAQWLNALPADIILPPLPFDLPTIVFRINSAISNLKSQISPSASTFPKGGQGDFSAVERQTSNVERHSSPPCPSSP